MSNLALFPLDAGSKPTVMETIMKPLSYAARPARWLMAAGLALAAMHAPQASAQTTELSGGLNIERGGHPNPPRGEAEPFFEKTGVQRDCDYVVYNLRFGAQGDPAKFVDPDFTLNLQNLRMDFRDTLPAGLEIVDVQASGDGTDAVGGPLPAPTISTSVNPNDTAEISDFRLTTADLDGSGEIDRRYIDIVITAKIDQAAFPAPTLVDNQGFVTLGFGDGLLGEIPSHDPALPDDGDPKTGEPTSILIDVTGCESPATSASGRRRGLLLGRDRRRRLRARWRCLHLSHACRARARRQVGTGFDHHPRHHHRAAIPARPDRRWRPGMDHHRCPAGRCRASRGHRHRQLCRPGGGRRPLLHADRRHRHSGGHRMSA